MVDTKRLKSVVQGTAHHAMSDVCQLHPYLGVACRQHQLDSISIDLLNSRLTPAIKTVSHEIESALASLKVQHFKLLAFENIAVSELSSVEIEFFFKSKQWPIACAVKATTQQAILVESSVDSHGNSFTIPAPETNP